MAFHVQTVSRFTPSISESCAFTRPLRLSTHTQSSWARPSASARARDMYSLFDPWICRSQAFIDPQEWYIAIGRCVTADSG